MMQLGKGTIAAIAVTSMSLGAIGAWVFAPAGGSAATTTTTSPNANGGPSGTFHSNEDPAHEQNESPQREAQENSGQFSRHCHHGADNGAQSGQSGQSGSGGSTTEPGANNTDFYLP
jgi:hypothetical protein